MPDRPRVLVLDGQENALSMVRSLGRRGVWAAVSGPSTCAALRSRFCRHALIAPDGSSLAEYWDRVLIENPDPQLDGAVLLTGSDSAVEFVAQRHADLVKRYRLDEQLPALHLEMLDKQRTLEIGKQAGCAVPGFWPVADQAGLAAVAAQCSYPIMLKPIHSHQFQRHFRRKHWVASNATELLDFGAQALAAHLGFMVCEVIAGPDTALSSYYTYIDASGQRLFEYTKRVLRRYPANAGGGTCHESEWLEETAVAGRRFFAESGYRGLGNIEFKRDPRDGELKIIECNPRFTAAQELLVDNGLDICWIIYQHLIGEQPEVAGTYLQNRQLWYPVRDFYAAMELRKRGELTVWAWLRSLRWWPAFPYFKWWDPWPAVPLSRAELRGRYAP